MTPLGKSNYWAYKMLDASAKVPRTWVTSTKTQYPGNFDSCLEIATPIFTGQHCMMAAGGGSDVPQGRDFRDTYHQLTSPHNYNARSAGLVAGGVMILLGRCVPSTCSKKDVEVGFNNFIRDFDAETAGAIAGVDFAALNCHTVNDTVDLDAADYGMIVVIAFFGTLLLAGTTIDVLKTFFDVQLMPEHYTKLAMGFSAYTNTLKLFKTQNLNPDSLLCINGIRAISLTWVVLGHVYSSWVPGGRAMLNNPLKAFADYSQDGAMAAVLNAFPSVDSFFFIGATLLTYLTLKVSIKSSTCQNAD